MASDGKMTMETLHEKRQQEYEFNTQAVQSPLGVAITEPSLNTLVAMWIVVSPTSG